MEYNPISWWLSVSIKPLPYRIWKYTATTVMFIAWVVFVAVFREMYWSFCVWAVIPVAVIDVVWDMLNYAHYLCKGIRTGDFTIPERVRRRKSRRRAKAKDAEDLQSKTSDKS